MYAITMKRGILLAAFGSGSSQGESTLRRFDAQVRKAFPDVSVRWAFTSMLMRERLASERKKSDSVHKALKKMAFEKFTHVAVQPVHVIPGLEYGDIVSDADELRADGTFASLVVGAPLLTESQASVDRAARARSRASFRTRPRRACAVHGPREPPRRGEPLRGPCRGWSGTGSPCAHGHAERDHPP